MKDAKQSDATAKGKIAEGDKPQASEATGDAEALLKADHRKVEKIFDDYENATDGNQKSSLARQACTELVVHSMLEEEIFYPACREKNVEDDALDEAQVEHDGVKVLIAELLNGKPDDEYYDAKVKVLSEYVKHHVGEEENATEGIFAKAKKAGVDMKALGARMAERKKALMQDTESLLARPPQPKSLTARQAPNRNRKEDDSMARNSNDRERDEYGRFMSDDDDRGGGRSRGGYSSRSRYEDDDDDRRSSRGRNNANERERDEYGRFMSDDDDRGGSRGRSSGRYDDDDDRRSSRGGGNGGRGGWFGDSEGHSEASRRGWDDRGGSSSRGGGGRSMSRSRDDDDDDRRSSRGGGNGGRGGWFGDSEGHSEAARRGWDERGSSRGGRYDDDDDDRRSSRSGGGGRSQGGWFGDSEGHAEAARRGWEERSGGRSGGGNGGGGGRSSSRSRDDDDDDRRSSRGGGSGGGRGHGGWFGDSEGHSRAARRGWEDR